MLEQYSGNLTHAMSTTAGHNDPSTMIVLKNILVEDPVMDNLSTESADYSEWRLSVANMSDEELFKLYAFEDPEYDVLHDYNWKVREY